MSNIDWSNISKIDWSKARKHYDFYLQHKQNPELCGFCCIALDGSYAFEDGEGPSNIGDWTVTKRPAQPIYTKQMDDAGELPEAGMKCNVQFIHGQFIRNALITYMGDGVGCYKHPELNKEYTFALNAVIISGEDTRTDIEKSFDSLVKLINESEGAPTSFQSAELLANQIINAGWSGKDE